MRLLLVLLAGGATALAAAPSAFALGEARLAAVDVPVSQGTRAVVTGARREFTLVGLHWRGSGRVLFRTRSVEGRWSTWRQAAPEEEDRPDAGSSESRRRRSWHIGNPWWVGPSDRVETRTTGRVARVRAYLVWSPETGAPFRAPAAVGTPLIVARSSWGADESIRGGPPAYAPSLRFGIVHHTAGRNDYSRAEAAAIVRGIQLYHVRSNGWNDIGYNFLVDRFGTIYEGRYGGIDRNVVGAHALGFNTGSVGVAVLGTYGSTVPSRAAQDAVARLLAWRLDLAHLDPLGLLTVISGGSERFASGLPVLLRTVSGHRDTGFTECPGSAFYSRLDALAATAARIGGLKIYDPRAEVDDGAVLFQARLSAAAAWSVVIADATGVEVARGSGTGTTIDWLWSTAAVPGGRYVWTIRAGPARPASGKVTLEGTSVPLAIESVSAEPETITPNGDGQAESSLVTFRLTAPANVTVEVTDSLGAVVSTVVDRVWTRAGEHSALIDGTVLPDGGYLVTVTARTAAGLEVTAAVPLTVTRTLGLITVTPDVFSPNGDGRRDRLVVGFSLAAPADVRVRVVRDEAWVATPLVASLGAGPHRLVWDGRRQAGVLRDGSYSAVVEATDEIGTAVFVVPFVSDTVAPSLRVLGAGPLRIEVSEPAVLRLRIDGTPLRREVRKAGVARIRWSGPVARVRAVAWDAAGNASAPLLWVAARDS